MWTLYTTYLGLACLSQVITTTWITTTGDENKLNIFERKIIRKMYGPVFNPDTQMWERSQAKMCNNYMEREV
jgi:hypothetical protein